jgi:hypothetical protein
VLQRRRARARRWSTINAITANARRRDRDKEPPHRDCHSPSQQRPSAGLFYQHRGRPFSERSGHRRSTRTRSCPAWKSLPERGC